MKSTTYTFNNLLDKQAAKKQLLNFCQTHEIGPLPTDREVSWLLDHASEITVTPGNRSIHNCFGVGTRVVLTYWVTPHGSPMRDNETLSTTSSDHLMLHDLLVAVMHKTREDVEDLKRQWEKDPCWDIEETTGFKAFADELREYRLSHKATRKRERQDELEKKAAEIGCPGNIKLAEYVLSLEQQIDAINKSVTALETR
jgi:hypothetical protein